MTRGQIGSVQAIWRYPVKSLRGESVNDAEITERGVEGDRLMALRELDRGGIMSARFWAAMLDLSARFDPTASSIDSAIHVDFPDGASVRADEPSLPDRLSGFLHRKIQLEKVRRERMTDAERSAVIRGEALPPSRDFFDEDTLHLVASGTLAHLRDLQPAADFDPCRFRANIYIDTGDEAAGFIEDHWLGGQLAIGHAVRIAGLTPSIRCAITTHPQSGLPHDPSILRTAWEHHQAYVGVFASVVAAGRVRLGDPVILTID